MSEKLNNQSAFDKVWDWFVVQGHGVSMDSQGTGMYRGPGDLRCAIGCLIPDELYMENMEYLGITDFRGFASIGELFAGIDLDLLRAMQNLHDVQGRTTAPTETAHEILVGLTWIAKEYSLTIPEVAT